MERLHPYYANSWRPTSKSNIRDFLKLGKAAFIIWSRNQIQFAYNVQARNKELKFSHLIMGCKVAVEGDADVDQRCEGHSAHHENRHQDQHHPRHPGAKIPRRVHYARARLPGVFCQLRRVDIASKYTTCVFLINLLYLYKNGGVANEHDKERQPHQQGDHNVPIHGEHFRILHAELLDKIRPLPLLIAKFNLAG